MNSFLSPLSERREMRDFRKSRLALGEKKLRIEPRSSRIGVVCATDAPLHVHLFVQQPLDDRYIE
jgi:hypothetical protein